MNQYRYIKLRNGEDIIAMTSLKEDGVIEMTLPFNVVLNPSITGKGTVIKLSPLVPFTRQDRINVLANEVVYTTTIDEKFVAFYDKAVNDWVKLRDEVGLDIMSPKQELDRGADALAHLTNMMKQERLLPEDEMSIEEELELYEYEESQKKILH